MCLRVKQDECFRTSKHSKYVYKTFKYCQGNVLMTPYQHKKYYRHYKGFIIDDTEKCIQRHSLEFRDLDAIEGGVIHCYDHIPSRFNSGFIDNDYYRTYLMKIPKGTPYIVSHNGMEIGARRVEFVRQLRPFEITLLRLCTVIRVLIRL